MRPQLGITEQRKGTNELASCNGQGKESKGTRAHWIQELDLRELREQYAEISSEIGQK